MRSGRAAIVGECGIENGTEWLRRHDVVCARSKTLHAGTAAEPKDIESIGGEISTVVCEDLSALGRCIARDN
jgi:hypothetical protein